MSSILKALKKVNKEKSTLQGGTSPIAREILNDISRPEGRVGSRSRLPLIFLFLLAGGVLGGVLLMRDAEITPVQTVQDVAETAPVVASETVPVATPEAPVEPPVVALEQVEPPPVPVVEAVAETPLPPVDAGPGPLEIAEEIVLTTRDATAALKDTATTLRDTADALKNKVIISSQPAIDRSVGDEKDAVSVVASRAPITPVAVARPRPSAAARPASGSTSVPVSSASRTPGWHLSQTENLPAPELSVSEIHWRPLAKDRLAVVNDLPVLEGVDIEGARVDRIFKDRIRFVVNGRYLEVKVNSEPAP